MWSEINFLISTTIGTIKRIKLVVWKEQLHCENFIKDILVEIFMEEVGEWADS